MNNIYTSWTHTIPHSILQGGGSRNTVAACAIHLSSAKINLCTAQWKQVTCSYQNPQEMKRERDRLICMAALPSCFMRFHKPHLKLPFFQKCPFAKTHMTRLNPYSRSLKLPATGQSPNKKHRGRQFPEHSNPLPPTGCNTWKTLWKARPRHNEKLEVKKLQLL